MGNEKNIPYFAIISAIASLSHSYQNTEDHTLGKTKKAITFP